MFSVASNTLLRSLKAPVSAGLKRWISVGQTIPSVEGLPVVRNGETVECSTNDLFKGKKVALFGIVGAYTPVCAGGHIPGFLEAAEEMKGKVSCKVLKAITNLLTCSSILHQGISDVICLTVNDKFVTKAFAGDLMVGSNISFIADGSASFTKAIEMDIDLGGGHLGVRSKRFSAIVDDGKVVSLNVEKNPGELDMSDADTLLSQL